MINAIKHLQTIVPLTPELVEYFYTKLTVRKVERRQYILREGQVCDYIFFIKNGLLRTCSDSGEIEMTNMFLKENDIFTVPFSFYKRQPTFEKLQSIEESELLCLHYDEIQSIYKKFPSFNLAGRLITEEYMSLLSRYNYISRIKPAELRYQRFMADFPELLGRVPDKDIASFLGMNNAHLSRLKNKRG